MDTGELREYLKRVTADLRRTRQRLRDVEADAQQPIAIVGIGCRSRRGAHRRGTVGSRRVRR
ncbi:polyketide synthase docking domain-containing protein [Micromonospora sp. BRA006-A]|nr:polyketide synthase docking domain-containing protein [Micromonospora sp. BRA006-A]